MTDSDYDSDIPTNKLIIKKTRNKHFNNYEFIKILKTIDPNYEPDIVIDESGNDSSEESIEEFTTNGKKHFKKGEFNIIMPDNKPYDYTNIKEILQNAEYEQFDKEKINILVVKDTDINTYSTYDERNPRKAIHITKEKQFEQNKFNIIIVNNSSVKYKNLSIRLWQHLCYPKQIEIDINDINDIKQFSRKVVTYDYVHEIVPMSKSVYSLDVGNEDDLIHVQMSVETVKLTALKFYYYKLTGDDWHPTIIYDKNNPEYFGYRPPNMKIIIQEHDVQVLTYY